MRVLLFSGHMVDRPDRAVARFPVNRVAAARRAIEAELDRLGAGADDRAITSGANGGDLLFAADCLRRGLAVEVWLPYARGRFVETSVLPGGPGWLAAFERVLAHPRTMLRVLPPLPQSGADDNPYARCNQAMLERALALAAGPLEFVCLWDGSAGDGPGGTEHLVGQVRERGGHVHWIDTRALAATSGEEPLAGQV